MKKSRDREKALIEQINAQYGKLPPQAIQAEEALLGELIWSEGDIFPKIDSLFEHRWAMEDDADDDPLSKTNAVFYKEEHQKIYRAMSSLHQE